MVDTARKTPRLPEAVISAPSAFTLSSYSSGDNPGSRVTVTGRPPSPVSKPNDPNISPYSSDERERSDASAESSPLSDMTALTGTGRTSTLSLPVYFSGAGVPVSAAVVSAGAVSLSSPSFFVHAAPNIISTATTAYIILFISFICSLRS